MYQNQMNNYGYYQNPYQANPYYQNQMQQCQQNQIPMMNTIQSNVQALSGRYVSDFSEITANDVPMDGKYALFAKNDMSEVHAKVWDGNGNINTIRFKAISDEKPINIPNSDSNAEIGQILRSVDDLKSTIDDLKTIVKGLNQKSTRSVKKDGDSE